MDKAEALETFTNSVESYLLWDRLKAEPHQAGNFHGIIIGDVGASADIFEARKRRAATWIIDNARSVAEVMRGLGEDPKPVLTIANHIEQNPDDAPAAVRAAWPNVKAAVEAATLAPGLNGSKQLTSAAGKSENRDDKKDDTEKNSQKKRRPLNDAARECIRNYQRGLARREKTSMEDVVKAYCSDKAGSETGIMRRLNDNPEEWKTSA